MTWIQIAVIGSFIAMSIITVAICDITIIKEIRKLRETIDRVINLIKKEKASLEAVPDHDWKNK